MTPSLHRTSQRHHRRRWRHQSGKTGILDLTPVSLFPRKRSKLGTRKPSRRQIRHQEKTLQSKSLAYGDVAGFGRQRDLRLTETKGTEQRRLRLSRKSSRRSSLSGLGSGRSFQEGKRLLCCRWIFNVKYTSTGLLDCFKDRHVAQELGQVLATIIWGRSCQQSAQTPSDSS